MSDNIVSSIHERVYVYNFHFHLVWVTKYRHEAFTMPKREGQRTCSLNDIPR